MNFPTFTTERLILQEVTAEDIPAYQKHFVDYEVIRHLAATAPWPYPDDGVATFLSEFIFPNQGNNRWMWGIFLKTNPEELIGAIELWRPGKPENRGFWLGREYWNQGIMSEAVLPILDYAFTELGFEKLVFSNARGNLKSRRIKEKTGAKFLRTAPAEFVDKAYDEQELWELTREDWQKQSEA